MRDAGCDEYTVKSIDREKLIQIRARMLARAESVLAPMPSPRVARDPTRTPGI
jgi:hypothetical protein